ncbi:uncharacterized protein MONBRDRAFT_11411 [Monosiga brevicollis MX1]|uniref:Uncharacterized protein n=1 Tax=Monosiga brevicollis TaxID=81824 RepID=A9V966_MONBE|nr:uncharacterized protein MONBRDRAFT_11411 [Monosiga brevicollis MX1]EDQ86004.1 predicted protein [Monosiga brevicollis MX1]|eukprot:XP_001749198.1 hypothetical protein [Monosiga brevicollis MX1]
MMMRESSKEVAPKIKRGIDRDTEPAQTRDPSEGSRHKRKESGRCKEGRENTARTVRKEAVPRPLSLTVTHYSSFFIRLRKKKQKKQKKQKKKKVFLSDNGIGASAFCFCNL